jgi:hypothetical protein
MGIEHAWLGRGLTNVAADGRGEGEHHDIIAETNPEQSIDSVVSVHPMRDDQLHPY